MKHDINSSAVNSHRLGFLAAAAIATMISAVSINFAQTCEPPPIQINAKSDNIFTAEQEMWLGEAILEKVRRGYGVIDDPTVVGRLQMIVDRLASKLPATGVKFRIFVSDIPSTNAFAFPGGIVMVTRKMVSFARSEDELAWVIAHELGHATERHGGQDYSRYFRTILKVTSFRDREDVVEKYNQLLDQWYTKPVSFQSGHENDQQHEADKMGVYAHVASGYDASKVEEFWTRFTRAKKKSGFSAIFGSRNEADLRLGEMVSQLKTLPTACKLVPATSQSKDYSDWRARVISFDASARTESVPGLVSRTELTPLRSDIELIRFSPNGEYILAQDTSTVTLLRRQPLTVLFQVPAENARPAEFSFDSTELINITESLHVQRWNIAQQRLVADYEVSVPGGVWQTRVSPDGNFVAAYKYSGDLTVSDVRTGDEIYREKKFFVPAYWEYLMWRFALDLSDEDELTVFSMRFSPDGKYFLAGKDASSIGGGEKSIVVDLTARKSVNVGDNVKRLLKNGFTFLAPDKLVGRTGGDIKNSGIFSFPDGERKEAFELGGLMFTKSASGNFLVVRPVNGAAVGVFDLTTKKYVYASRKNALDVYGTTAVAERKNGELALYQIGQSEPVATVELPKSDFGKLRTVSLSENGEWLSVSDKSRGAVWQVNSGARKLYLRTFRGSYASSDGSVYADFPASGDTPRSIAKMEANTTNVTAGQGFKEGNAKQYGRYLVIRRSLKEDEVEEKKKKEELFREEEADKSVSYKRSSMEIRDVVTGTTLWTREFRNETPWYFISSNHGTMSLAWSARSEAAKEIARSRPEIDARLKAAKDDDDDYLIEVLDPVSGTVKSHFFLETGKGSFDLSGITAAGDYLLLDDTENRQLVYSLTTGNLIRRSFGSRAAISPSTNLLAVENGDGRITVTEILSGREIGKLILKKGIAMMQFSKDGRRLQILTRDQVMYVIDTVKLGAAN